MQLIIYVTSAQNNHHYHTFNVNNDKDQERQQGL